MRTGTQRQPNAQPSRCTLAHPHTCHSLQSSACEPANTLHKHTKNTHRQVLWIHHNKDQFPVSSPTHRNSLDTLPLTKPHPPPPLPPPQPLERILLVTEAEQLRAPLPSTLDWRGREKRRKESEAEQARDLPPSLWVFPCLLLV